MKRRGFLGSILGLLGLTLAAPGFEQKTSQRDRKVFRAEVYPWCGQEWRQWRQIVWADLRTGDQVLLEQEDGTFTEARIMWTPNSPDAAIGYETTMYPARTVSLSKEDSDKLSKAIHAQYVSGNWPQPITFDTLRQDVVKLSVTPREMDFGR